MIEIMSDSGYHHVLNHLTQGSSILLYDPAIRWAWLTILRKARRGVVKNLTVASLSLEARIPLPDASRALEIFTSPDEYSTTPDHDGIRLIPDDGEAGTYHLVNWEKYRGKIETANAAARMARKRERDALRDVTKSYDDDTDSRLKTQDSRQEKERNKKPDGARKRGTRLPESWVPSGEEHEFARAMGFSGKQVVEIADTFRDYWHSQPGQKGVKLDWSLTWKNWIRREGKPRNGNGRPNRADEFPPQLVAEWQREPLSGSIVRTKDEAIAMLRKEYPEGYTATKR